MLNQPRPADMPHDYVAVAFDETSSYNLRSGDERLIQQLMQVYVVDRSERTFCCEVTPSYYLVPAYTFIVWRDEPTEGERDRLHERYCYEQTDPCYMHTSTVETYLKKHPDLWVAVESDPDTDLDEVREHVQGNCVL